MIAAAGTATSTATSTAAVAARARAGPCTRAFSAATTAAAAATLVNMLDFLGWEEGQIFFLNLVRQLARN